MSQVATDFETGTNGTSLSTGDAGSPTPFNVVAVPATSTNAYDTAHAHSGTKAAKITTAGTAAAPYFGWSTALGTVTTQFIRIYLYATANPATSYELARAFNGASIAWRLRLANNGTLVMLDNAGTNVGNPATAIALNQWVRIELKVVNGVATGQFELRLFNSPDSTVASASLTSAANKAFLAQTTEARVGNLSATVNIGPTWFDDVVFGASDWVGPTVTAVGASRALAYDLAALAGGSRSLRYDLAVPVGSGRALAYDLRAAVGSSRAAAYDVRAVAGSSRSMAYHLRAAIGAARALRYDLLERGTLGDGTFGDGTFGDLTAVGASSAVVWKLAALAGAVRELRWDELARAGSSLEARWDVAHQVATGRALPYDIREEVAAEAVIAYDVLLRAGASRAMAWSVAHAIRQLRGDLLAALENYHHVAPLEEYELKAPLLESRATGSLD